MVNNEMSIVISCDGTDDNSEQNKLNISKHPLVYFKISKNTKTECPYCGKDFVFKKYKK